MWHGRKHQADLNKKYWRDTTSLQLIWQYLLCNAVMTEITTLLNFSEDLSMQLISTAGLQKKKKKKAPIFRWC